MGSNWRLLDPICKEKNKWNARPFSFEPSGAFAAYLRVKRYDKRKLPNEACMCQNCGSVIVIGGWRLQEAKLHSQPEIYCDLECAGEDRSRVYRAKGIAHKSTESRGQIPTHRYTNVTWNECCECSKKFASSKPQRLCSKQCKHARRIRLWRARIRKGAKQIDCQNCGASFTRLAKQGKVAQFCSMRCAKRQAKREREYALRSSKQISSVGGRINRLGVFKQANWTCNQCGVLVVLPRGLNLSNEATVDHIIPLSKGGLHIAENVQCLCRQCNTNKGARLTKATQLRLF